MAAATTPIGQRVALGRVTPGGAARSGVNVSEAERWASLAGGGLLALGGLRRGDLYGLAMAAVGGCLVNRGLTGHCAVYRALGINTGLGHSRTASIPAGEGVKVTEAITIDRPVREVYAFWRDLEKLPQVMGNLDSVKVDGERSHWVAKGPMNTRVEWDAEIVNRRENELVAWRSLEGSQVATAGSVHFRPAAGGRGTEVHVTLKYDPPAGKLGANLAWLTGAEPSVQVREDLMRLKQLLEGGEVATTRGLLSGREVARR